MPRVRLPFCYEASFVKKGRKTVHECYLHGEVSADVPELAGSDVRTVAEWSNLLFPDDGRLNRTKLAHSRAVSWNGGLYVPAGQDMEDTVPADVIAGTLDILHDEVWLYDAIYDLGIAGSMSAAIGDCIRGSGALEFLGLENPFLRKPKAKFEPSDTIVNADSEAHRAIVQDIVDSLVFIDGTVWKRVPSIQLRLNLNRGVAKAWVTVVHGSYGYNNEERLDDKYKIDRYLHHRYYALNEIGRLLADIGAGIDVGWLVSELVIHDAEAISFNGASNFTARAMESCVLEYAKSLGSMTDERIDDWMAVRDAVTRHKAFPNEEMSQENVDRFLRLLDGSEPDPWARRQHEDIKKYVAAYRSANRDRHTPMPAVGHHDSDRWLSA
ncbi:hypothetical protein HFN89_05400 [Rhizobium laguerreae]|nr:hypothetical protein [Rhizobium laguerreae]